MRRSWSYYCPKCEKGFGDLEGEVIKKQYDGFGDMNKLIICPRGCGAWLVLGPYMTIDEFNIEDLEWWGFNDEQMNRARKAGYIPCTEHHWKRAFGDNRCTGCQMKYSYWLDVKRAIDEGNIKAEDWACKPHYHREEK